MNFLLYGYYGAGNFGDDMLLRVVIDRLEQQHPGSTYFVRDLGLGDPDSFPNRKVKFVDAEVILSHQNVPKPLRLLRCLWDWARILRRSDWLIFGGGTLFHARGSLSTLILQYLLCLTARMSGTKIAAIGVGVSAMPTPKASRLLKKIIKLSSLFLVRDAAGLAECGGKAEQSGDLFFAGHGLIPGLLPKAGSPGSPRRRNSTSSAPAETTPPFPRSGTVPTVALTVYPPACDPDTIDRLALAVRMLDEVGWRTVFLTLQSPGVTESDETIFDDIAQTSRLPVAPEVRLLPPDPARIEPSLADIDLVAGMRFHALVMGILLGRPCVALAHDNKLSDLCTRLGLPWLEHPGDWSPDDLLDALAAALEWQPSPDQLREEMDAAELNFRRLFRLTESRFR